MSRLLRALLQPLNLTGLTTVAAVALSFGLEAPSYGPLRWLLLGSFATAFVGHDLPVPSRPWRRPASLLVQAAAAFGLIWLGPNTVAAPVLLVVVVAQAAMHCARVALLLIVLILNAGLYAALVRAGVEHAWLLATIYASFEAFAALSAHYASRATRARDALARVNADLLATRTLLADSARDAERLRLARELHDIAGHKLTAIRINLRMLAADPQLAGRSEISAAEALSAELLADIRHVVQSLRDDQGLDLETALRALAAPLPRPRLQLVITPQVQVTNPAVAEAVLRLVQEALTNTARHADASRLQVHIDQVDGQLHIDIEDDGRAVATIHEGNGIAGMRERLAALRGRLELGRTAQGGLHLSATLPG